MYHLTLTWRNKMKNSKDLVDNMNDLQNDFDNGSANVGTWFYNGIEYLFDDDNYSASEDFRNIAEEQFLLEENKRDYNNNNSTQKLSEY